MKMQLIELNSLCDFQKIQELLSSNALPAESAILSMEWQDSRQGVSTNVPRMSSHEVQMRGIIVGWDCEWNHETTGWCLCQQKMICSSLNEWEANNMMRRSCNWNLQKVWRFIFSHEIGNGFALATNRQKLMRRKNHEICFFAWCECIVAPGDNEATGMTFGDAPSSNNLMPCLFVWLLENHSQQNNSTGSKFQSPSLVCREMLGLNKQLTTETFQQHFSNQMMLHCLSSVAVWGRPKRDCCLKSKEVFDEEMWKQQTEFTIKEWQTCLSRHIQFMQCETCWAWDGHFQQWIQPL